MGALRLRDLTIRMRFGGVDDIGELDAVLDEEHRNVIADEVVRALVGVKLGGESAGVAHRVCRSAGTEHRREAHEDIGFRIGLQERRLADLLGGAVAAEHAVRRGAAGVHRTLRDALVVEVHDLLPQVVILQQRRAACPRLQGVVGVVQPRALGGGEVLALLTPRGLPAADGKPGGGSQIGAALIGLGRQRFPRGGRFLERRRLQTRCARDVARAVLL